ncbi:MAG TPA: hypothetical protein VGQ24_02770, partial [Gemmatimonadales bacterium]|nr:hypothetical protein [Gemmatimonadales bacterium]
IAAAERGITASATPTTWPTHSCATAACPYGEQRLMSLEGASFFSLPQCNSALRRLPQNVLTRDELLDNLMLYWLPGAGASRTARPVRQRGPLVLPLGPVTIGRRRLARGGAQQPPLLSIQIPVAGTYGQGMHAS